MKKASKQYAHQTDLSNIRQKANRIYKGTETQTNKGTHQWKHQPSNEN